jgi:hypothetical protein
LRHLKLSREDVIIAARTPEKAVMPYTHFSISSPVKQSAHELAASQMHGLASVRSIPAAAP